MNELLEEVKREQGRKRRAELMLLQAQAGSRDHTEDHIGMVSEGSHPAIIGRATEPCEAAVDSFPIDTNCHDQHNKAYCEYYKHNNRRNRPHVLRSLPD